MSNLVIVESPTKAKTISRFLGDEYKIESSFGHIRDLPKSKMGVNTDTDFSPEYEVPKDKQKRVNELKRLAKKADMIYFATDEDREGEAISWHLQQLLETPDDKHKRIVFHEITKEAILESLKSPRTINIDLVNAQQARRVLDRLVGYELSPFLWKKIARGLSAGRVQSVAVRLIVEREREIEQFDPEEFWTIEVDTQAKAGKLTAKLYKQHDKRLDKFDIADQKSADTIVADLEKAKYTITDVITKDTKKNPYPPFTTSTLQQAANSFLGFSAKQTMMVAQQLYEGIRLGSHGETGLITYMRTDSVTLASKFQKEVAEFITDSFGKDFVENRQYKTKSKNAQEAHEAIRPTGAIRTPESIKDHLDTKQFKLYQLIWQRAVASQMTAAKMKQTTVEITADVYGLRTSGSVIAFPGWLKVYPADKVSENLLPEVTKGEVLTLEAVQPEQHFTQPPPRYSEASLVKALEELEIGRPSTYAPTISTILSRNYVTKEGRALQPTDTGKVVNDLLVEHFPQVVDYDFTATVENDFDEISHGRKDWKKMIKNFYEPFHKHLEEKENEVDKEDATGKRELGIDPKTNKPVSVRVGRFGPFVQLGTKDDEEKPQFASLKKGQSIETITLEEALKLLTLPRVVYTDEAGNEITANIGRFGPYLKIGDKFASLKEDDPYTIGEERAREVIAEFHKKQAEKLIKKFDDTDIRIEKGRWGPYVSEGRLKARVPKDIEDASTLTLEQCQELLAEAAENKKNKSATTKKTTAKKPTKKKATKKKASTKK